MAWEQLQIAMLSGSLSALVTALAFCVVVLVNARRIWRSQPPLLDVEVVDRFALFNALAIMGWHVATGLVYLAHYAGGYFP